MMNRANWVEVVVVESVSELPTDDRTSVSFDEAENEDSI